MISTCLFKMLQCGAFERPPILNLRWWFSMHQWVWRWCRWWLWEMRLCLLAEMYLTRLPILWWKRWLLTEDGTKHSLLDVRNLQTCTNVLFLASLLQDSAFQKLTIVQVNLQLVYTRTRGVRWVTINENCFKSMTEWTYHMDETRWHFKMMVGASWDLWIISRWAGEELENVCFNVSISRIYFSSQKDISHTILWNKRKFWKHTNITMWMYLCEKFIHFIFWKCTFKLLKKKTC